MSKRSKTDQALIDELSRTLETAAHLNKNGPQCWAVESFFQDRINDLLVRAGRKPVTENPIDERTREVR